MYKHVKRHDVLTNARLAGSVKRYHTWPMINQQTVGEHTWQLLRIWWMIFGPLQPEESTYVIWHDGGELVSGDPPFPVKARNPTMKREYDRVERIALEGMLTGAQPLEGVSPKTKLRAKICDLLDMAETALHELAMGNTYAWPVLTDTHSAVLVLASTATPDDARAVHMYVEAMAVRWNMEELSVHYQGAER